ncbi:MAG: UDP-N-acetylmuramoyl-L-alanyl-D-glutamate--2,6-diaminopimelate ligase [Phycisphaerales bacterium]
MKLSTLIQGTGATLVNGAGGDTRICDVTDDSRSVLPGSLFIARPGTAFDGSAFILDAVRAGASAVLTPEGVKFPDGVAIPHAVSPSIAMGTARIAERFFGEPSSKLRLVGVTGTNGKTTIVHLVRQLLRDGAEVPTGLIGTVEIDDGAEVAPAALTTPGAIEMSYTLATMVENGLEAAAIECSSHALDQERVGAIDFGVAVYTNLSGDHLDYHETIDGYARAKSKLFANLREGATAIINIDDPHAGVMIDACASANVLTCSLESAADCTAEILDERRTGTLVRFTTPVRRNEVLLPLVGRHNAMNALQALAAAQIVTGGRSEFTPILTRLVPPPGRLEPVRVDGREEPPFSVFVDYAHTDDALRATLAALAPLAHKAHGKLHVVFGCGGNRDTTKRPRMARVACELADRVTVTSDNPRTEQPAAIIRDVLAGVPEPCAAQVDVDADRAVAIRRAVERAADEDIVVIAGKGHETEQLLPDGTGGIRRIHFSDREVACAALVTRFGLPTGTGSAR